MGFVSISLESYVAKHLKSNPGDSPKAIRAALRSALRAHRSGTRCECGERIWVIGSAIVGNACFTCITGEADPSDDYELEDAL